MACRRSTEFPFDIWSKIALQVHRDPPRSVLAYGDPQGYEPLREAIAAHLRSSRESCAKPIKS
jgi:GntR family transcriptional regulator/MocR family aminotransferase